MKVNSNYVCLFAILFCVCLTVHAQNNRKEILPQKEDQVNIIFDTDMGSDCDDAGALALLHKFADEGKVNILGVIFSSGINRYGAGVCDAINTYYGRGNIPLGQYAGQDVGDPRNIYSEQIAMDTNRYLHDVIDTSEDMIAVYKRILREQPDRSVTLLFVGHPHALYFLIHDAEGNNLIKTKVQKCVFMARTPLKPGKGWNFCQNGVAPYVADILTLCPVDMYFSGSGSFTLTGHKLLPSTPENNPVREAYRLFGNSLREGRPSWDPVAVMFAVKPHLFVIDSMGSLVQNEHNEVYWDVTVNRPNHKKVEPVDSVEMGTVIEKMIAEMPEKRIVFFDAEKGTDVTEQGVTTKLKNGELLVTTNPEHRTPGIVMNGNWSLPESSEILLVLTNYDDQPLSLRCRLESPNSSDSALNFFTRTVNIGPGETLHYRFNLPMRMPDAFKDRFFAMRDNPYRQNMRNSDFSPHFDPQEITQLSLFMNQRRMECHWGVKMIAALPVDALNLSHVPEDKFFPMIDKYGQFIHHNWPGKIHDDSDLKKAYEAEQADLAANPSPKDRNQYGGWTAGPQLEATGHFRVEKLEGTWWLVDPEGYLFWSHGTNCVIVSNAATPITDREFYFADLPPTDGAFASCYATGRTHMFYYKDRGSYQSFDFSLANIIRKYGENWADTYAPLVHQRLRSWGMNTIANWSSPQFYRMQRTPYTAGLNIRAQPIRGSEGYWGQFLDPFDPVFRQSIQASAQRAAETSGSDPWCIGYFVQNEIHWGNETSLAMATFTSPAEQPVKIVIVGHLKQKYVEIGKLNDVWQSQYKSWDALLQSIEKPDEQNARNDLLECYRLIAEQYFRVIKEELQAACPNKLYLGCRFTSFGNQVVINEASKYCDVVSFNVYQYDLDDYIRLPEGFDKACIIGEFHFGALDRGMFHTGLCPVESQEARAAAYEKYVRSALNNRYLVGTHWFQYQDQATTGRGLDGENFQIGLLTVCDTPYPETVAAVRKIGDLMYEIRYRKQNK